MARVTIKPGSGDPIGKIARSDAMATILEVISAPVFEQAKGDPNEEYRRTLRMRRFYSRGPRGRVSIQIGAAPTIGARVEAVRGTLARALGLIG